MYCQNCGKVLNKGDMFCNNCGMAVNVQNSQVSPIANNNLNNQSDIMNNVINEVPNTNIIQNGGSQPINNESIPMETTANVIPSVQPIVDPSMNQSTNVNNNVNSSFSEVNYNQNPQMNMVNNYTAPVSNQNIEPNKKTNGKVFIKIVAAVLGFIAGYFLVSSFFGKNNEDEHDSDNQDILDVELQTYSGDGYQLEYDNNWKVEKNLSGTDTLINSLYEIYFTPIGRSVLSDAATTLGCDFSSLTCQKEMYDYFDNMWSDSLKEQSVDMFYGSNGFSILKDDIYYAYINYGVSMDKLNGKFYILASSEKDILLTFMSNYSYGNSARNDEIVYDMLEGIVIDSNVDEDKQIFDYLDSMSNWNRYSSLREGNLGVVSSVDGGWRILGDSESYWEFKNGEFWWYKTVNDLNDNYWYGSTKIVTGKEGLKLAGLDENKVDDITSRSNGDIAAEDIYTIVLTPTKIISEGVDKSSTNIPEDTKWTYVWIVVDHGDEGIEAQVLNVESAETSYYVKIKD